MDSELGDSDTAIELKSNLAYVDSELADRDTAIALKSNLAYVDSELDDIDTAIALKSDSTYVDSELESRDTAIALKSNLAYVDSELDDIAIAIALKSDSGTVAAVDTRLEQVERVVAQDAGKSYHYLRAGEDALVIRGPNVTSATFLGSSAGAQEGKALFYKDMVIEGSLTMGALSNGISTGSLTVDGSTLTDLLSNKENGFTAVLPLSKGFNLSSGDAELSVDSPFCVAGRIN